MDYQDLIDKLQFELGLQRSLVCCEWYVCLRLETALKALQAIANRYDEIDEQLLRDEQRRELSEMCETGADRCPVRE